MASSLIRPGLLLLLLLAAPYCSAISAAAELRANPPIVEGLSWKFYEESCPKLEKIVRDHLKKAFEKDKGLAAALLRLHFHDCFVQGCDGSVLLAGSASEQSAPPNLSLRPAALATIEKLREIVHKKCRGAVSCADLTALAARDAVQLSGGPKYGIPLGRRDGLSFATREVTLANLPPPTDTADAILAKLAEKDFNATEVVALSGGHTIGVGHCSSFGGRLYPTQDPVMDQTFAKNLREICPASNTNATTVLDLRSPNKFDNKYYVNLMNRQGLFVSDQDLYTNKKTKEIVKDFAVDQNRFFQVFAEAMIKMGQLTVLTGTKGEIRANCSATNSEEATFLETLAEDAAEAALWVEERYTADL